MGSISLHAQRVRRVEEAFASLPARYLGAQPGFDATFQVRLGDVGRTWEVRAREGSRHKAVAVAPDEQSGRHLRRSLRQLKSQIEHERLRAEAARRRGERAPAAG